MKYTLSAAAAILLTCPLARGDVLIAASASGGQPWIDDVKAKIQATGLVVGDIDTVNLATSVPSLATLLNYDAVLVFTDSPGVINAAALGDALADYVDAGRGVVAQTFYWNIGSGGRFFSGGYSPFQIGSQTQGIQMGIGAIQEPTHPVLHGVVSFDGGSSSYHNTGALAANAIPIADWPDGRPFAAEMPGFNGRIIGLNFYPPSNDVRSDFWLANTDGDLLMANALAFAARQFTLDFESEDDLVTPLVNGQHINTEFGALVTITSSGDNAGLGIFDATVGGPNDPSQDLDLLVDTGNILILQTENFPPDGNDIFPRPNDDDDGGTITFNFETAVEAHSVRLIDIDAGDSASSVVLTDGLTLQRIYSVPSNWTGDRTLAQPGQGTLDLTTLLPQAGFASSATATEAPGFDPANVVRIDVQIRGSGGIDDLRGSLAANELAEASMTYRNGSGGNPMILDAATVPVLGQVWAATLDCSGRPSAQAVLELRLSTTSGLFTPFGEVLVAGPVLYRTSRAGFGAASQLTWQLPLDVSLCGLEVYAQGMCREASHAPGNKRMSMGGTLSNAIDLVLGF